MLNALRRRTLGTLVATQVAELVEAREARAADGRTLVRPSQYWADFIENFAYVFELSDASLDQIRRHTYHLTSDIYLRYYLASKQDAERLLAKYAELRDATHGRVLAEPSSGIGYPHEDGLVSWDLLRYMSVIRDLLDANVLNEQDRLNVVEIGGGYGGLCRAVAMLNPKVRYTIVDLEETLFFSKSYLDRTLPDCDVRLVRDVSDLQFKDGRIHLIPQHLADELEADFDLAVNHQSIQEMQVAQIERYLDFISRHCRRFYSRNLRRQDLHLALSKGLSLDTQSQVLTRFPDLLWQRDPAREDNLIDDNLPRFVVSCIERNAQGTSKGQAAARSIAADAHIDERALHRGSMLDAYRLSAGSSFVLTLRSGADVLALAFVTWATRLPRLELHVVIRDDEHQVIHRSTVVYLGFHDWEEVLVDLSGIRRSGEISVEFSVMQLGSEGLLGLPLFESNVPGMCRLTIGESSSDERVPAGRLLVAH